MEADRKNYKRNALLRLAIIVGIVVFVNLVSGYVHGFLDLTEDKRFTLSEPTKKLVDGIEEIIFIRVLLEGDFPAGFKRLQASTEEILRDIKGRNSNIQYVFEDPTVGTTEEITNKRDQLASMNVAPTALKYFNGVEFVQKAIYPVAIVSLGQRNVVVPLLEEQLPGMDENLVLNNSVALIEYKFANAIQKLLKSERQNIGLSADHGEMSKELTQKMERELRKFYNIGRFYLDSVVSIDPKLDLLMIIAPKKPMNDKNQFKLDQYIMNGGKVIWMIEKFDASLDSIAKYQFYVPRDYDLGFEDMLFKYGVRVQPNLIMDLESTSIPQIVGMSGDKPQTMMFKWPYHPLISSKSEHPIVKNIDKVNMAFPSSIDTLSAPGSKVRKTVLLSTSPYSKLQFNPMRLNFEMLKTAPDPSKFDKKSLPVAVLLEGEFESAFKNRVSAEFQKTLDVMGTPFKEKSVPTKQIVISDSDFMKSLPNIRTGETEEIGFNKWEFKYFKGNKDFIINAVEYMLDESGVLSARSREVKLRMLDAVRTKSEKKYWQTLNIIVPLVFLAIFGFGFNYLRRRKYAQAKRN